jgi:SAM-dependent methyltransferase
MEATRHVVDGPEKRTLDDQEQHWQATLAGRPDMFGNEASDPAQRSAAEFRAVGFQRILELGGGQGRDSLFFGASGFEVHVLDYAQAGVETIRQNAARAGLASRVSAALHDVRLPLPVPDAAFDACYAHMLFCMALTTAELTSLTREVRRALRPGGLCVYTVRNASDPDHGRGVHRGEGLWESNGFIVHFFDRAKVEQLAHGYDLLAVEEFEEGKLPRRLYRVVMRKP